MRFIICTVIGLVLFSASAGAATLTPLKNGDKILWVGNSYSDWFGTTPDCLKALLASADPAINIQTSFIVQGGAIVKNYWISTTLGCIDSIRKGGWKYFVLQSWEDAFVQKDCTGDDARDTGYPACQDTLIKYAGLFYQEVRKVNGVMILFDGHPGTWSYTRDFPRMQATYARIKTALPDVITLRTSLSWDSLRALYPVSNYACPGGAPRSFDGSTFISLLYHDCGHQNGNGKVLDTYTFYSFLTGKNAKGLNPTWPGGVQDPDEAWDPELFPLFADIAMAKATKQRAAVTAAAPITAAPRTVATATRTAHTTVGLDGRLVARELEHATTVPRRNARQSTIVR